MLAARALACRRGGRLVFARLALDVAPGGALLLRGPNGSGKSTLLRCLAGLIRPAAGEVLWQGAPIAGDPDAHRTRLHYLGHLDGAKAALTVWENLRFWQRLRGRGDPAAAEAALDAFALEPLAERPARALSAGQRRRLGLARLLAAPAPLWLLDEPNAALDDAGQAALARAIAAHRAQGGLALIAAHGGFPLPGAETLALERHQPAAAAPGDAPGDAPEGAPA
ncbi:MAG: heme ABC exporter ATP-binding protein CcmA [Dongiaceae bacterium]